MKKISFHAKRKTKEHDIKLQCQMRAGGVLRVPDIGK
jgi:hypothetical protein